MADDIITLGGPERPDRDERIGAWATRIAAGRVRVMAVMAGLVILAVATGAVLSSKPGPGTVSRRPGVTRVSRAVFGISGNPLPVVYRIPGNGCSPPAAAKRETCTQTIWIVTTNPVLPSGGESVRLRAARRPHPRP